MKSVMPQAVKTRSPWPYAIVGSFVALAIFDAVIVTLAIRSHTATIDNNPYDVSQRYEEVIEAKRAAKRDSLASLIKAAGDAVNIKVDGFKSTEHFNVTLSFMRPSQPALDRKESVIHQGPAFIHQVSNLKSGLWLVTVDIAGPDVRYRFGPEKIVVN